MTSKRFIVLAAIVVFTYWLFFTGDPRIKSVATGKNNKAGSFQPPPAIFWNEHRISGLRPETTIEDVVNAAKDAGLGVMIDGRRKTRWGVYIRIIDSWGERVVVKKHGVWASVTSSYKSHTAERQHILKCMERFGANLQQFLPDA